MKKGFRFPWLRGSGIILGCLLGGLLLLQTPMQAKAIGKRSRLKVPYLLLPGMTNPRPRGLEILLAEVERRTSLTPVLRTKAVTLKDARLYLSPLVVLSGNQGFSPLSAQELSRLRSYLTGGGLLFIDMAEGSPGGAFDRSVRRMAKRLFPRYPLRRLPAKHTLFKSFYLTRRYGGRVLHRPYVEGVTRDDRSMILYSMNDHNGAWSRDSFGNWTYPVVPGGFSQREHALRFGINLVMYALCVNYKSDMVHVPFIMRRRQ
jgi:hypothetical protein